MHKNIFHTNEIQNKVLQIPRLWKVSQNKVLVRKDVIIRVLILKFLNITDKRQVIMRVSITTTLSHPDLLRPLSVLHSVEHGTCRWE